MTEHVRRSIPKSVAALLPRLNGKRTKLGRWLEGPKTVIVGGTRDDRFSIDDPRDMDLLEGRVRTTCWYGEWRDGRYVPTTLIVHCDEGIHSDDLRVLSVPRASRNMGLVNAEIVDIHNLTENWPEDETNVPPPSDLAERGREATDAHLRYAGQVYELAKSRGNSPYRYLAEQLGVTEVAAIGWAKKARAAGYIKSDSDNDET